MSLTGTFKKLLPAARPEDESQEKAEALSAEQYWTEHNVTLHRQFATVEESLAYMAWRNQQYPGTIELLPIKGHDGKIVLDYGCGPGNDLLGFATASKPERLIGIDVSSTSLAQSKARMQMHGFNVEFHSVDASAEPLPFDDASIDYIHSAGVLHHLANPLAALKELRRVLKPGGMMRIMVYNYDSLWMHLYVAYQRKILNPSYANMSLEEVFKRSTDGDNCPISQCYKANDWVALCAQAGLECHMSGVGISLHEAALFPLRFEAAQHLQLNPESRQFLLSLEMDKHGYAVVPETGFYAGINGCYIAYPK